MRFVIPAGSAGLVLLAVDVDAGGDQAVNVRGAAPTFAIWLCEARRVLFGDDDHSEWYLVSMAADAELVGARIRIQC
jgi:hypothetical protein